MTKKNSVVHDKTENVYTMSHEDIKATFLEALRRIQKLQIYLNSQFVCANMKEIIRMMLASAIAQEPVLFIGGPGLAKTELAIAFFEGIGLRKPIQNNNNGEDRLTEGKHEKETDNKYYEYLLSAFTLPEELFGPFRIGEGGLQSGKFVRVNTNMLTGPGVRGCFLDEIFRGSSNILNSLLTLINERRYFNDGRFVKADLALIMGASNTTPAAGAGTFSSKVELPGKAGNELMAFYDRFTIRLLFRKPEKEEFLKIREKAFERERVKMDTGRSFEFETKASIDDILLLSRALFPTSAPTSIMTQPDPYWIDFFMGLGQRLSQEEIGPARISPRKLIRLEKIAYALALLDHNPDSGEQIKVKKEHCDVFKHIWENEQMQDELYLMIDRTIKQKFE